jgi:hypothetical protein
VNKFIACNGGTIYLDRMNECEREREEARKNVAFKFESCLKLPNAHTYTHTICTGSSKHKYLIKKKEKSTLFE